MNYFIIKTKMEKINLNKVLNSIISENKIKNTNSINERNKKEFIQTHKMFRIINNMIIIKVLILLNLIQLLSSDTFFLMNFIFQR